MAAGDLFKRTLDAGSSLLGMTRERAEAVVREWVDSGDLRKARAQKAIDDLMARSRKMTDDLRELVRREIAEQVSTLGFATRDELADLEGRLRTGPSQPGQARPTQTRSGAARRPTKAGAGAKPLPTDQAAPIRKAASAKTAAAEKAAAKKAAAAEAPAKKATAKKSTAKKATKKAR